MGSLRPELLAEEDPLMVGRVVEPGELAIAELRVELGPLERKSVDPGGMTSEQESPPLGVRHQAAADAAAPQFGRDPQIFDEQPASIDMADQPGPDFGGRAADKQTEIGVARVAQKRRIELAQRVAEEVVV